MSGFTETLFVPYPQYFRVPAMLAALAFLICLVVAQSANAIHLAERRRC